MSRLAGRLIIAMNLAANALVRTRSAWPAAPRRILIAHRLLLGDTLMLTPLLKKLRQQYPDAQIVLTMHPAFVPLFSGFPYGAQALAFDPHDSSSVRQIIRSGPYDLGIVPGDNRHSWLARAAGCKHIVAHAHDRPLWKNWPVDTQVPYPLEPAAWGDMVASLIPGAAPERFESTEWPQPSCLEPLSLPPRPYVVLHPGASNPLRTWFPTRWLALAELLSQRGLHVIWSGGPSEAALVSAVDPQERFQSYAGKTDLCQLLALLKNAALTVCVDSGVAHMARLAAVPSVVLYGQGSNQLFGTGQFWSTMPQLAVFEENFPCRDQRHIFRRELSWVRRCDRRSPACTRALCMEPLTVERVLAAAEMLLHRPVKF